MNLKQTIASLMRRIPWLYPFIFWLLNIFSPRYAIGVAGVVLNPEGKILLLEHVFRYRYPWGLPGGWVGRRERPQDALRRELQEEVGLTVRVERPLLVEVDGPPHHLETCFLCHATGEVGALCIEILAARWVDPVAPPDGLRPLDREMIERALAFCDGGNDD